MNLLISYTFLTGFMSKCNKDFFRVKKDWSITKDDVLGTYLKPYFVKLLSKGKPIVYIDCFAGKGKFDDGTDGSPLIALRALSDALSLSKNSKSIVYAYFIELNYFRDLEKNIPNDCDKRIRIEVVPGKFEENIEQILSLHINDTVFLYMDPYGIKAIDVDKFNSFKKNDNQSIELLINFNTWGLFRNACRVLNADFSCDEDVEKYLIEYDPYNNLLKEDIDTISGGDYWEDIIKKYKIDNDSKSAEQELSKGIAYAFKKGFKYVLNIPVKSNPANKVPKYRLFHLSNHKHGCIMMADAMHKRINESVIRYNKGQTSLFDYSSEGELENLNLLKKEILARVPLEYIHLLDFLARYFSERGVETSSRTIIKVLKELEASNEIMIKRIPPLTKNGKKSMFMDEDYRRKVVLKRQK